MGVTRYTDGNVTIDLGGAVEEHVRRVALATHGAAVFALEREAEGVRKQAASDWYGDKGVRMKTGRSGKIGVRTTIGSDLITVTIGSLDLARAKYIRRPGPLSVIRVKATWAEWWEGLPAAEKAKFKARQKAGEFKKKKGTFRPGKEVPNPAASDGKYLLQEFIGKPARQLLKRLNATLPTEIDAQMRNGRRA